MKKAVILTDGGGNTGFGHLTRCFSLGQAFERRGYAVSFIINGDDSVKSILGDRPYQLLEWQDPSNRELLVSTLKDVNTAIIDSYLAEPEILERISRVVPVPVYLDDNNEIEYPAGIVLNWNIYAPDLAYPEKESVTYLLGSSYLSLREPFRRIEERPLPEEVKTVLVTFGGDDSKNMTPKVLRFLARSYPDLSKKVIIGKAFTLANREEIDRAWSANTEWIESPDGEEMKRVMESSDIAVSSGGQTLYELARTGVPAVVIAVAENQLRNVAGWANTGFIKDAGYYTDKEIVSKVSVAFQQLLPYKQRIESVNAGRTTIPGNGARKIIDYIESR
jgi:spore coat polysaccharide biosynthesis predicted glycosyltransferase SpsG